MVETISPNLQGRLYGLSYRSTVTEAYVDTVFQKLNLFIFAITFLFVNQFS